jgi:hypothetical protein
MIYVEIISSFLIMSGKTASRISFAQGIRLQVLTCARDTPAENDAVPASLVQWSLEADRSAIEPSTSSKRPHHAAPGPRHFTPSCHSSAASDSFFLSSFCKLCLQL